MTTVSVIVATFGTEEWETLGNERAWPTALAQGADDVVRVHLVNGTVAQARNEGAQKATSEWLCFLDGDDELTDGYIDQMRAALAPRALLTPLVRYVDPSGRTQPDRHWPEVHLSRGNWMVIGTLIERDLFLEIGGFDDLPAMGGFEDWALWIKAWKAGGVPTRAAAVYVAHVNSDSRHRGATAEEKARWHYAIGREHFPDIYDERWLAQHVKQARRADAAAARARRPRR